MVQKRKNKLNDRKLRDLLSHYSTFRLRNEDFERDDLGCCLRVPDQDVRRLSGQEGREF